MRKKRIARKNNWKILEHNRLKPIQKQTTKYILCDYNSGYKVRLMRHELLPLMYIYDLADIMFFIKSMKLLSEKFNIFDHVKFTSGPTRSAGLKLRHNIASTNSVMNSYFYRIPRLWNSIPITDLSYSLPNIKFKLKNYFWNHFIPAPSVWRFLFLQTILSFNCSYPFLPLVIISFR